MPVYEYQCPKGHKSEGWRPIAEYKLPSTCPLCGREAARIISPVRVFGDFEPYESPATGKWITGRREHREDLARSGCRLLEPGESAIDLQKKGRAEVLAKVEAQVDEAVERTAAELGVIH